MENLSVSIMIAVAIFFMIIANVLYKEDRYPRAGLSIIASLFSFIMALVAFILLTPGLENTIKVSASILTLLAAVFAAFISWSLFNDHSEYSIGFNGYKICSAVYYIFMIFCLVLLNT